MASILEAELTRGTDPPDTDKLSIASQGGVAQLWTPCFVLEVPEDEVAGFVISKFAGDRFECPHDKATDPYDWRKNLRLKNDALPEEAVVVGTETREGVPVTVLHLKGGEPRYLLTALHDLFVRSTKNLKYQVQPGKNTSIEVWDGEKEVGCAGALCYI